MSGITNAGRDDEAQPAKAESEKWAKRPQSAGQLGVCPPQRRGFPPLTVTRRHLILALASLAALPLVPCTAAEPANTAALLRSFRPDDLKADHMDMSLDGESVLRGNAVLRAEGTLLTADEIRYNFRTGTAAALGNVTLTRGPQRILAESLSYQLSDRTFKITRARIGQHPLYLSGENITGTPAALTLENATVTYQEPGALSPTLHADRLTYTNDTPEKRATIRAEGARIGVGAWQPFRFPTIEQDARDPLLSHMSVSAGYRSDFGAILGAGLHLPITSHLKAGADLTAYTKRGLLLSPGGTYRSAANSETPFTGSFDTGYIHDDGERLDDLLGRPIQADRGYIDWKHQQKLSPRLSLDASIQYWSDSEIIRDYHPDRFYASQVPDSFLEAAYAGNNFVLSAFTRLQLNSYHRIQERLPEIRFDLLPTPIHPDPLGLYQLLNASVAALREDPLANTANSFADTLRADRFDVYYSLTRPINPTPYLNLTPIAGARLTHYSRATGGRSDYTRTLGEFGADASLQLSGLYDYKNKNWDIDGLRHLITPRLSYRYVPQATKGRAYIPPIDREVFFTYLRPLGLSDSRTIDDLGKTNTLRLQLDQTLQTRDATYGSRDLARLNLAADARFGQPAGQRTMSDLHTEFSVMPARWISFDLYQRIESQHFELSELNTGLTLRDADQWTLRLSNHFLTHQIQEYIAAADYKLSERFRVYTRLRYDVRADRFSEQHFGVEQNHRNLWLFRYGARLYDGNRRESSVGFQFEATLLKF